MHRLRIDEPSPAHLVYSPGERLDASDAELKAGFPQVLIKNIAVGTGHNKDRCRVLEGVFNSAEPGLADLVHHIDVIVGDGVATQLPDIYHKLLRGRYFCHSKYENPFRY